MFKFEELDIWKESINYASRIYKITESFPAEEKFGLVTQLRNAVISISLNIAEGSGRYHNKDFIRFLQIAISSLYEVVSGLFIAKNERYINDNDFKSAYSEAEKIAKMINAFISYLKKNHRQSTID
ncbi:MAG: hypothetical protein DRP41_03200 [Thermodesulfobacteriota bacterium]|nr:MAG: hypothetical protein DRP41_03200 [Thermodesulfobacteriota bacterium]